MPPRRITDPVRLAAQAHGLKRYLGPKCNICNQYLRFVYNNACVKCKFAADMARYYRKTDESSEPIRRYFADGDLEGAKISEHANRQFLSALAREKAHQ